ncbi:alpha-L-fucosidase [Psychromicrobium lacuslunae]|uniref:alpha-L-fucosidase n=1 Tax=Psychromicrobium lacuslunae TaxID=1618207 RepID=A0A0D4C434_9MICC|nr:alpha-L-fucosidase [Psychromicrobium lacuslunae]
MELNYGASRQQPRQDAAMQRFREHRFGQFVHWGLYAMPAGYWQGTEYRFAAEFLQKTANIPEPEWAELAQQFSAEAFDADAWAALAARSGVKYATFTTKHHDGFCLWPSQYTDFHSGNTPAARDFIGELVAAYQRHGIDVYLYYSVLDWHHPDWRYRLESAEDQQAFKRYLDFAMNQLVELAQRYPSVKGFWFDGTWDESVKANGRWTWEVEQRLKELIPGLIVSSRLRADDLGARHRDSNGSLMGDYESGYERRLPDPWDRSVCEQDWEACMTIPQASWGYHAGPWAKRTRKSAAELIDMIAHCTSLSGNFLLNFGPRGDGSIDPEDAALAEQIGNWLAQNGAAIYGKGVATNWSYPGWGYYTQEADSETVYAVVTKWPTARRLRLQLPAGERLLAATLLREPALQLNPQELETSLFELELGNSSEETLVFELTTAAAEEQSWTEPNPDVMV